MEHLTSSPETNQSPEASSELEAAAGEQLSKLETTSEHPENAEKTVEVARKAVEVAPNAEAEPSSEKAKDTRPATRLDKEVSYKHTMQTLQSHMAPATRAFSKVIHTPAIEKTSEVLAKTAFRPSATLGATTVALVIGGGLYLSARHYGYALSGSEFILLLIAGAVIGLLIEGLSKLIRKR